MTVVMISNLLFSFKILLIRSWNSPLVNIKNTKIRIKKLTSLKVLKRTAKLGAAVMLHTHTE